MGPFDDDGVDEPLFDDRGPEDWEELFSRSERDPEDLLPAWLLDGDQVEPEDDPGDDSCEATRPVEQESDGRPSNPSIDHCLRVPITTEMWSESTQWAIEMDRLYGHKNDFGDDDGLRKQRRGVLGNMAYAQAALGDWRRHREALPNQADFGLLDVKSSRTHPHRNMGTLKLIEAESSPGFDPPCYSLYVQIFIDDVNRVAVVAGWCTGEELWSEGKSPIPRAGGRVGYQRPVVRLRSMLSLLAYWDQVDDGQWSRFRPANLGT